TTMSRSPCASGASRRSVVPSTSFTRAGRMCSSRLQGDLDIVVGRSAPEHHDPAIRFEALYLEPIHLVARPRHPLFALEQPGWPELLSYRWILWPKGTPIRNA
ncbi:LysR substrate-binding domain-containing protein, partial [Achromobacter xylosoxidans]